MNKTAELQSQIDMMVDQLNPESSRYVTSRRERDEIRAAATRMIQERDMLISAARKG